GHELSAARAAWRRHHRELDFLSGSRTAAGYDNSRRPRPFARTCASSPTGSAKLALSRPFVSLHSGLAQSTDKMINPPAIAVDPAQNVFHKSKIAVERSKIGECGLRLGNAAELSQTGNDVAQARRPVAIERPGAPTDLDCLNIMMQLVMGAGEGG